MEKPPSQYESAEGYLIQKQGVARELVEKLRVEGFRHTTMICPDIGEQMDYEAQLKKQYSPEDIKIIPLSKGGRAYWVRDKKE